MLNQEQQRAVEQTGPCLVIAGAGTGKTKTIVEKIAHIIRSGVTPDKILALTFSNEAAAQLKKRAAELLPLAASCRISTFHSFCADFIRAHAKECGVSESFSILQELDAAILLKRELQMDTGTALRYANTISKAKDLSLSIDDYKKYIEDQENLLAEFGRNWVLQHQQALVRLRTMHLDTIKTKGEKDRLQTFVDIYENYVAYKNFTDAWIRYEIAKEKLKSLDFADLNKIILAYVDRYGPDALAVYDHIIIDEFQDTNRVQFELLQHLNTGNITVVGDQDQTVYAFRGAYANNIDKFKAVFGVKEAINLSVNYRSSDRILRTAHKLIKNNYERPDQSILLHSSDQREGERPRILQMTDAKEQARRIIEEIETLAKSGVSYKDITVLYRSHSSSSPIKRALSQRGIPYTTAGGSELFYQPEVKTVISYLYVLNNFSNTLLQADQAWWRLLHGRFGLSAADSTILAEYKKKKKISLQNTIYKHLNYVGLSAVGKARIAKLTESIDTLRAKKKRLSHTILDIYEISGIAREYDASREAMGNLRRLHDLAEEFETFHGDDLASFISYIELVDEIGGLPSEQQTNEESIKLMTVHAAKGLEFDAVFLIDLVKDKFPLTRGGAEPLIPLELNEQYVGVLSENYKNDAEKDKAIKAFTSNIKLREERRLAYVALTRAKRHLFITLARDYGSEPRDPSQFLGEIGIDLAVFSGASATKIADDLDLTIDTEIKSKEGGDTELDRAAAMQKRLMAAAMERKDLKAAQYHIIIYQSLLESRPIGKGPAAKEAAKILESIKSNPTGLKFPQSLAFSVTSLGTYLECAKKYELKHILNMPSRDDEDDTSRGFGNTIHEVLDTAVKQKINSREKLDEILKGIIENDPSFDLPRATRILDVFWERNKNSLAMSIATEKVFRFTIGGFTFAGKIDRIDNLGDNNVRIVDYKTGYVKYDVGKDDRERQLMMYALAIRNSPEFAGMQPSELVLDMLEKEKPLEFVLKEGTMSPKTGHIKPVSEDEIKKGILETAKSIAHDYEQGFPVAETDAPCRFCSYKLYCPKWG